MEVVRPSSSSEEDVIVVRKFGGMKMWWVFYELRERMGLVLAIE